MEQNDLFPEIRKLRKKLRQIENLEKAQRPLMLEEKRKVKKKQELRSLLQEKLKLYDNIAAQESVNTTVERHKIQKTHIEEKTYQPETPENIIQRKQTESTQKNNDCGRTKYDTSDSRDNLDDDSLSMQKPPEARTQHDITNEHGDGRDRNGKVKESKQKSGKRIVTAQAAEGTREANYWDQVKFSVLELIGHNDIICSVDCNKETIISGSRDTSIKVWDAATGTEIRSLGGHTDSVTAVCMVPPADCHRLASEYDQESEASFIISCSLDCSVRIWVLSSGEELKSIYTFNAVTCMGYVKGRHLAATGYTGGKVELWDILTGESSFSTIGHEEAVTSLRISNDKIVTASVDGMIKLWELRENAMHPIFVSENIKPQSPRTRLITRKIHTAVEVNNKIYFGDNGCNIKVLDWREGVAHKLRNHKEGNDFGFVDSIQVTLPPSYLICSGYDLDLGHGYLNFFSVEQEKYLATLTDHDVSRIFTIATSTTDNGQTRLVTGGAELRIWEEATKGLRNKKKTVASYYNEEFSRRARDSEEESEADSSDEEEEECPRWSDGETTEEKNESWWWCSLL